MAEHDDLDAWRRRRDRSKIVDVPEPSTGIKIDCPVCAGSGSSNVAVYEPGGPGKLKCAMCKGEGRISAEEIVEHPIEHRKTGDAILYIVLPDTLVHPAIDFPGMGICRTHLLEMRQFPSARGFLKVRAAGVRERASICPPRCAMCEAVVAHGNVCYNDRCKRPLHPQWPAVYCSNSCALDDL